MSETAQFGSAAEEAFLEALRKTANDLRRTYPANPREMTLAEEFFHLGRSEWQEAAMRLLEIRSGVTAANGDDLDSTPAPIIWYVVPVAAWAELERLAAYWTPATPEHFENDPGFEIRP